MTGEGRDPDTPSTEELRAVQAEREADERERAEQTRDPTEELAHVRRADRAAYLRDKLEEQEDSERE